MTGATTSAKSTVEAAKAAEFSAAIREEIIATVKQAQQFTLGAVTTWVDAVRKVAPELPAAPYLPARTDVVAGLTTMFDATEELLASQRKFASDLANVLVPAS